MRTTVTIEDKVLAEARGYTGIEEAPALVREAFRALLEREALDRLAAMGGSDPDAWAPPRRRRNAA